MSSPLNKAFTTAVIVADIVAVVYFGGNWILTGSPLPSHDAAHADHIIVAAAKEGTPLTAAAPVKEVFDLAAYVADPIKGKKVAAKCKACHTFESGGPNRTGPNLWNMVNAPIAGKPGFSYSSVLSTMGGSWDDDAIHAFLERPRAYASGTKMQFNGIKKPADRADLIAWLKTLK